MSAVLHLLRVPIRLSALARYAGDRGWTRRQRRDGKEADANFDPGRALHHLLDETFGPAALKPFRLVVPRNRDCGTIYAYTSMQEHDLLTQVRESADPVLANGGILELGQLATKQMPDTWIADKKLGFDVRVRPVVRIRKPMANPRPGKKPYGAGSEVDAFVVEAQKEHQDHRPRFENSSPTASGMQLAGRDRTAVYKDWLAARLGAIAQVDPEKTELVAFERSRVSRGHTSIEGPDATFHGELTVKDPEEFQTLLARGVGRHCAFGYGMLLLRPPRRR